MELLILEMVTEEDVVVVMVIAAAVEVAAMEIEVDFYSTVRSVEGTIMMHSLAIIDLILTMHLSKLLARTTMMEATFPLDPMIS